MLRPPTTGGDGVGGVAADRPVGAETGFALLRRTPTGSELTPAGSPSPGGRGRRAALALAQARLEQSAAEVSGTVRIGGFQSFLTTVLAPALPGWRERYPALRIQTIEADEAALMRALRAGSIDALAVELDAGESYTPPRGTTDVSLLDEPWKLLLPLNALVTSDVMDLSRLGLTWLGLDPAAANAKAHRRVRRELGGEASTTHTYFSYQNAIALVAAGAGVTLAPALRWSRCRPTTFRPSTSRGWGCGAWCFATSPAAVPPAPSSTSPLAWCGRRPRRSPMSHRGCDAGQGSGPGGEGQG